MTEKKLIRILCAGCIFLAALYALSFFTNRRNSPQAVRSALLNPKYADLITSISVTEGGKDLVISLHAQDLWIGTAGGTVFPVEKKTIDGLLNTVRKVRNMYIISDTYTDTDDSSGSFLLSEKEAIRLDFMISDGSVCSSIYFGANNYSGRRIYCRQAQSRTVYEIDDDIFPWLKIGVKNWADMSLVPQSVTGTLTSSDIQRIRIRNASSVKTVTPQNVSFADTARTVLSARASAVSIIPSTSAIGFPADAEISLDTGDGTSITLSFFSAKNKENPDSYYVVPSVIPGPARHDRQHNATVQSLSYALEISNWTFESLFY